MQRAHNLTREEAELLDAVLIAAHNTGIPHANSARRITQRIIRTFSQRLPRESELRRPTPGIFFWR